MASKVECNHDPEPSGYLAWFEWAEQKAKTHDQLQCPHCKLWKIWVPKGSYIRSDKIKQ